LNDFNQKIIEEFRANQGKVGGPFKGSPMLLLTTKGAKSGRQHTTPVVYLAEGDVLYLFASKAGAPTSPDWYHNLVANPGVTIELGTEKFPAEASVVDRTERDRLYAKQAGNVPAFVDYEKKTTRIIPVVRLKRSS
jgi:deazaflavin-dependent oxidoreductase (nitroreductase family)